jgi:protein-tyrosine-phosphatase
MAETTTSTVLFLCTGNYYRSRFAEAYFNSIAADLGLSWTATSRGLALERGHNNIGPMAPSAVRALAALGVLSGDAVCRFPQRAAAADLEKADIIVALKQDEHRPMLMEHFPAWAEKVEYWHIDDEPGVLGLIEREVRDLAARIKQRCSGGQA